MSTTKEKKPGKAEPGASEAAKPVAKPEPLEMPGRHGLQREPQTVTSLTRLCKLLKLSPDVSPTIVLREAAREITALRRERPQSDEPDELDGE